MPQLIDRHRRVATDLRVSLTDRCNLRCNYCMPADGLDWLPTPEILSNSEVLRLIRIGVQRLGIEEVRFTGGEPLLRPGLADLVAGTKQAALEGTRVEVSLTTNGLGLKHLAPDLAAAGLDRINVSLDSIRRDTFKAITRRDRFDDVVAGIGAAERAGVWPIKINAVLVRGVNMDQTAELLEWCVEREYQLRFIEQMPLDAQHEWSRELMVTASEIHDLLSEQYALTPDPEHRGSAPAETFLIDSGPHKVGIIGSVTRPFCGACNRVRLTADGQVRNCLFARAESDLRELMRSGATDEELVERWQAAVHTKAAGHGIGDVGFLQPARPMSAIGG